MSSFRKLSPVRTSKRPSVTIVVEPVASLGTWDAGSTGGQGAAHSGRREGEVVLTPSTCSKAVGAASAVAYGSVRALTTHPQGENSKAPLPARSAPKRHNAPPVEPSELPAGPDRRIRDLRAIRHPGVRSGPRMSESCRSSRWRAVTDLDVNAPVRIPEADILTGKPEASAAALCMDRVPREDSIGDPCK